MNTYLRGARTIVCIGCKLRRRTKNPTSDICRRCESSGVHASLPAEAKAEQTLREQLSQVTDSYGRPLYLQYRVYREGVCSVCSNTGPIYEEPAALCRTCHQKKLTRLGKAALKVKVECGVCKKMRRSVCLSEDICLADYLARKNGYGTCIGCGKEKQIWVKKNGARCRYCYKNYCARQSLMKFVDEYRGLNRDHFNDLIATIDLNNVDEKLNRRMRAFGKFFQTLKLPVPLTWESIEEAMPALGSSKKVNRVNTISMRSCLLDLAHLRVAEGLLEKREDYLARRRLQHNIALAPACFREAVRSYAGWLAKLKNSPATALSNLVSLNPLLWWCEARDMKSPHEVTPYIFEEYEQFLTWHWICDRCKNILPFDVFAEIPACDSCKAVDSMRKTRRHSHASVQKDRGLIRHFFRWAEITGVGPNPVGIPVQANTAFRHYSDDVIMQLVEYLVSPDAQPLEAVVFYLTIFHAFSTWELTHALLPADSDNPSLARGLSDAYYVFLPARPPTRRNHRPGRPEARIDFPVSATPWLKPLLQRYEQWRTDTLDNPTNRFLLVAPGRARHDNPVCVEFVRRVVKRGSTRAGVGECNPKRLRATAAVLHADSGVIGVLTALGWSASQGFKFTWHERREVEPRSKPEDSPDEPSSAKPPAGALVK